MAAPHLRGSVAFPSTGHSHTARTSIDRHDAPRVVPLKVLCLGCSRTGTASLRNALKRLGYIDSYHGFSVTTENPIDGKFWLEGKCPRVGKHDGREFGRTEFDQILGHCQAVADFPGVQFSEQLLAAYPNAKVILSVRNEDAWVRSMQMLYCSFANPSWRLNQMLAEFFNTDWKWACRVIDTFCVGFYGRDLEIEGRRRYREQNDLVRRLCSTSPGRLLEWNIEDGWQPICDFLDEQVPDCEFPHGNDAKAYWARMEKHEAFMGRDWRARRLLWVMDHWALSAATLGTAAYGLSRIWVTSR